MAAPDPALRPQLLPEDLDRALRPQGLDEFVGQKAARANLAVFIESARRRGSAMDHTLFYGPRASARPRSPRSSRASSA
jgi:holliday junction DNA helicase RuvB